jgi:UDP-N-acetylmuramate dehydrogenase
MNERRQGVPMAPRTSLGLGGPARSYICASESAHIVDALEDARRKGESVFILGGGSNVIVADAGFDGLVLEIATRGVQISVDGSRARVVVAAGEPWDELVATTVQRDLAGLECLSGIPGRCGATPIQNVGAYGCEVGETLVAVTAWDRELRREVVVPAGDCELSYRSSRFKRSPDRFAILAVEFELRVGGPPTCRYPELQRAVAGEPAPSLTQVRETVLTLRRRKSMVIDPADENRRSAGSFFTNPVVDGPCADRVAAAALASGFIERADQMPRYPATGGVKLAAGWLIEAAGMARGYGEGPFGLSSKHALAIVHRGGGTTAQLVEFARSVRDRVFDRFGVELAVEPVFVGMPALE